MIENRVRKLMLEEERLNKQIMIANKHSVLADEVRARVEHHRANKNAHKEAEAQRIEHLKTFNNEKRHAAKEAIARNRNSVTMNAVNDRENLKQFLSSNYSQFYSEKMHEQRDKQHRAADAYNAKHSVIATNKQNQHTGYHLTSIQH